MSKWFLYVCVCEKFSLAKKSEKVVHLIETIVSYWEQADEHTHTTHSWYFFAVGTLVSTPNIEHKRRESLVTRVITIWWENNSVV